MPSAPSAACGLTMADASFNVNSQRSPRGLALGHPKATEGLSARRIRAVRADFPFRVSRSLLAVGRCT